jgi:hypothetical protein
MSKLQLSAKQTNYVAVQQNFGGMNRRPGIIFGAKQHLEAVSGHSAAKLAGPGHIASKGMTTLFHLKPIL